jgi:hypothetical protein
MSTPESNTPARWWRWRWIGPAVLLPGALVNVMNPHHSPGLRMVSWGILALSVIVLGYTLYANYRERRRRRDP